jgi:hypothetical protein
MEHKMRITTNLLILLPLLFTPCSCALANIPISDQAGTRKYIKLMVSADIIHLNGGHRFISRTPGYVSKWNEAMFTPIKGKCPIAYRRSRVSVAGVESLSTVGINDGCSIPRRAA